MNPPEWRVREIVIGKSDQTVDGPLDRRGARRRLAAYQPAVSPYVDVLNAGFRPRRTTIDGNVLYAAEPVDVPARRVESRRLIGEALLFALGVYSEHERDRGDQWRGEPIDDVIEHIQHELREIGTDLGTENYGALLHDATDLVALAAILAARARQMADDAEVADGS